MIWFLLLLSSFIIFISWSKVAFQEGSGSGIRWGVGGTPFCKESSFKDTTKRHGRTMLMVRDTMLAERRNSRASRGLPRKIEKRRSKEKKVCRSWRKGVCLRCYLLKRSLFEEGGAQVWFLFSWTSLLSYHFVMISGFASFFFSFYLSWCMNASIVDFYYVLGCSWMLWASMPSFYGCFFSSVFNMFSEFYFGTHALGDENFWFSTQLATWLSVTYPSTWEPCTRTRPTVHTHACHPSRLQPMPFTLAPHLPYWLISNPSNLLYLTTYTPISILLYSINSPNTHSLP